MKKKLILNMIFMFAIISNMHSQNLPTYKGTRTHNQRHYRAVELFELTYCNNAYLIDGEKLASSAKGLGNAICKYVSSKKEKIQERDISYLTITLSLDKETPIAVVDSILDEITAFRDLRLIYKTGFSENSGFYMRSSLPNNDKIQVFNENQIYFPALRNIKTCIYGMQEIILSNRSLDSERLFMKPPPRPPTFRYVFPAEIILKHSLDSLIQGHKYFRFHKNRRSFYINNKRISKEKIYSVVENYIKTNKCVFIIDFNSIHSYNDLLELYEIVCQSVYKLRDNYIESITLEKKERSESINNSEIERKARRLYPLSISNFTLSDKLYLSLLE